MNIDITLSYDVKCQHFTSFFLLKKFLQQHSMHGLTLTIDTMFIDLCQIMWQNVAGHFVKKMSETFSLDGCL